MDILRFNNLIKNNTGHKCQTNAQKGYPTEMVHWQRLYINLTIFSVLCDQSLQQFESIEQNSTFVVNN